MDIKNIDKYNSDDEELYEEYNDEYDEEYDIKFKVTFDDNEINEKEYYINILEHYVNSFAGGLVQGSKEWLKGRKKTIGGSEMATAIGKNPYQRNLREWLMEKVGITDNKSFEKNKYKMQWGNLFEDLIQEYIEHDLGLKIIGTDIFIPNEKIPGLSYSPDGLGVLEYDLEVEELEEPTLFKADSNAKKKRYVKHKYCIVLFEFKCPYGRMPYGKVPIYYLPQIKTGLQSIQHTKFGIFAEGVFRRTNWDNLCNNSHYIKAPEQEKVFVTDPEHEALPLAYGFIGFYLNKQIPGDYIEIKQKRYKLEQFNRNLKKINESDNIGERYIDFGNVPDNLFKDMLDLYQDKVLSVYYSPVYVINDKEEHNRELLNNEYNKFLKETADIKGILPWKLFSVDYNYVDKDPNYLDPYMDKLQGLIDVMSKCADAETKNEKINIINEYFIEEEGSPFDYPWDF